MTDLEKFKKFFVKYGITFEDGFAGKYFMSGKRVDIALQEGSVWHFDEDGNFIKVVEGM